MTNEDFDAQFCFPPRRDRASGSSSLERLVGRMEAEAAQFAECSKRHYQRGNRGASDVAERARELLMLFAAEAKQANDKVSHSREQP